MNDKIFYSEGLMDLSSYNFVRAEPDAAWNDFVEASTQGTLFSRSEFIGNLNGRPGLWYCLKKNEIKSAVAVMETDDGASTFAHDLMIHGGVLFSPHDPKQNDAQVLSEEFRISSAVTNHLTDTYKDIHLATHPAFADLRPFLWHNYGETDRMFKVDLRYTSYVQLDEPDDDDTLEDSRVYKAANKSRRQEIRYGLKKGVVTTQIYDPDLFETFYTATFARQGKAPDQNLAELRGVLAALHAAGLLRMYVSRTAEGKAGSIAIFGLDTKRAYYLFGANDPAQRDNHTGTMVLWDGFRALSGEGISEVDLEGVNSPARGYFKLSFGGALKTYYTLELNDRAAST